MLTQVMTSNAVAIAERRAGQVGERVFAGRPFALVERAVIALRTSTWIAVLSGFFEPVFYLASFGFGIGQFVDGIDVGTKTVSYAAYIAPALLATSAMNGAIYDSTWNVFFKMKFAKFYDAVLATSLGPLDVALGEISWALLRGLGYSIAFMLVMWPLGLITTPVAIFAIPAAVFVAFGFAAVGFAVTSYMKSFQQMNWIVTFMLPMFLFSGSFFPIDSFPTAVQWVVKALPLWHANEMIRGIMLGQISSGLLVHVGYFLVMVVGGLYATNRRLTKLFLS